MTPPWTGADLDQAKSRAAARWAASNGARSNSAGAPSTTRPSTRDHHAISPMRATQHQGRDRVVRAREARFVELEKREVGFPAHFQLADVVTPEATRRPLGPPSAARRDG